MSYEYFIFYSVLAILAAIALPIPFMLWASCGHMDPSAPGLIPRGCFESDEEWLAYMKRKCSE